MTQIHNANESTKPIAKSEKPKPLIRNANEFKLK